MSFGHRASDGGNSLDSLALTIEARDVPARMHDDEVHVDEDLVGRLLSSQFPDLAGMPLAVVEPWGTDNAIWRLGDELVVRLPRIHWAQGQVALEAEWLPRLAAHLPVAIPTPVAVGEPADGYPYRWAVHRWLPGTPARSDTIDDPVSFAVELAGVVRALWAVPTDGAPPARNRARPLEAYDAEARAFIQKCAPVLDIDAALEVWEAALRATPHEGPARWVHGDLDGNCIVDGGRLAGVVDWGSACAGDPAVDVQMAWSSLFTDDAREAFLDTLGADDAVIARSKGALIHQTCGAVSYYSETYPQIMERSWHKLAAVGVERRT